MTYRPLPDFLTIKTSSVNGLGLFTKKDLPEETELGITHVKDDRFENGYIRTPLGGFFNHSDDPNCEAYVDGEFIKLKTVKAVRTGDELLAYYWLYKL
jgi:SET domain-containing protein